MSIFNKRNLNGIENKRNRNKTHTIMIVDDEVKQLESMSSLILEKYDVITASDGQMALEIIENLQNPNTLSVIVSDQRMPQLTGIELFERIVKKIPNPIRILLTGCIDVPVIVDAINKAKVDEYIHKPFDPIYLLHRVKMAVEKYEQKMAADFYRKQLEENREELKKAVAEKDLFLNIIAHDLRGPIQALSLASELLYTRYDDLTQSKIKEYIQKVYESEKSVGELLENLLKWAMSVRGTIQCNPEKIDIHELVTKTIEVLGEIAGKKHIQLSCAGVAPDTLVFADRDMILFVIRNIISNSIKFITPDSDGLVDISAVTGKDVTEITISDNGIGMDKKTLNGLFHPHIKTTRKGTSGERGTGLGLIVCKEFLERNGGQIEVTSEPGHGTSIKVTLPIPVETSG